MKVRLDIDICQGHGLCALVAPDVFAIDEETGLAELREEMVDASRRSDILEAISACPVNAIVLVDG